MLRIVAFIGFAALVSCFSSGEPGQNPGQEPINAEKIYGYKCALCHGNDGKAGIAGATDLSASRIALQDRIDVITGGRGSMMPFRDLLTQEEIEALAIYIEQLRKP